MEFKAKKKPGPGLNRLVTKELEFLRFSILRLSPGEEFSEALKDWECGIALLSGHCRAAAGGEGELELGPRRDVFQDPPWGLFAPAGADYRLRAISACELALSYAPGKPGLAPVFVPPEKVVIHQRGKPGFRREVRDIIVDQVDAGSILIGETVNLPGEWSSYPPHKHDQADPGKETRLEEVYFYKLNPPQGFGIQRLYTPDRSLDIALTVEQDDLVIIPRGYHPVAAAPGYALYYFWALAGPERKMRPKDDPEHQWVLQSNSV